MLDLLGAGLGLLGGLMGGDDEQTQTRQMDPRLDKYVYGDTNNNGLLNDAFRVYGQQMQTGGLNDMQRQGLDMQYQFLTSPQYMGTAANMSNLGNSLMGGGVAGNPFLSGGMQAPRFGMSQASPQQTMQQTQPAFQFKPMQQLAPNYATPPKEVAPMPIESQFETWLQSYLDKQAKDEERHSWGS